MKDLMEPDIHNEEYAEALSYLFHGDGLAQYEIDVIFKAINKYYPFIDIYDDQLYFSFLLSNSKKIIPHLLKIMKYNRRKAYKKFYGENW